MCPPNIDFNCPQDHFYASLKDNEAMLRTIFSGCSDICFQLLPLSADSSLLFVYILGVVDTKTVVPGLFQSWVTERAGRDGESIAANALIKQYFAAVHTLETTEDCKTFVEAVLQGNLGILLNGEKQALYVDICGTDHRGVEEPSSENAIRGPRESFTETIFINLNLIRRRIQTPRLKSESIIAGKLSKTKISLMYIDGIAKPDMIALVKERLSRIKIDSVLESGYIEEFIEDKSFSPFPQIQNTERPDIVAAALLEGKAAIVTDGTPYVLIVPMTFWTAFQSVEDYYERFIYATLIRWTRFSLFFVSLYLPSMFVAITTFHPQLLPTNFLYSITMAREGVPFPSVIEALLMEFLFEGLREAGIRLPQVVGSAVSIVGALVIGQAAVQAGIVSAPMVIIVSMTGIASFAIPRYNMGIAFRILRFPLLILSGSLGLYGIAMGTIIILIHLVRLESFGVPYMSPIAPLQLDELKDTLIRAPRWGMERLPISIIGWAKRRKYGR
ncbi:spore germination protein [Paenibacillus sp. R14(2021)]|uniref:spore germination protein n=1 Tax=Paenibacillus sp. R14(2021) TaxID=2859228 RepID=UPI001C612A46|nr:spore germination protein [Paenibacillus sp. R14(2021)]